MERICSGRKILTYLLALCLFCGLLVPAASAVGEVSSVKLTYDITSDGSHDVTAETGDVITVAFRILRTDSDDRYNMQVFQNEIIYDQSFFEYVDGSAECLYKSTNSSVLFQTRTSGEHILKSSDLQSRYVSQADFCTFQLKVIGTSGSGIVSCSAAKAYEGNGNSVDLTLTTLTVTIPGSDPGPVDPGPVDPGPVDPGPVDPGPVDPGPVDPGPVDPGPVDPGPVDPGPVDPSPSGPSGPSTPSSPSTPSEPSVNPPVEDLPDVDVPLTDYPGFIDVHESDWFYHSVYYVVTHGWFEGTSATTFEPNGVMTRAMFATAIARMAGVDVSGYGAGAFDDVPAGQWYTGAVAWAAEQGIVEGYGDGRFAPNEALTREQMFTMLYRYTNYIQGHLSGSGPALESFHDSGEASSWAETAVRWGVEGGLVQGTDMGLELLRAATRAEMTQLLTNYDALLQM